MRLRYRLYILVAVITLAAVPGSAVVMNLYLRMHWHPVVSGPCALGTVTALIAITAISTANNLKVASFLHVLLVLFSFCAVLITIQHTDDEWLKQLARAKREAREAYDASRKTYEARVAKLWQQSTSSKVCRGAIDAEKRASSLLEEGQLTGDNKKIAEGKRSGYVARRTRRKFECNQLDAQIAAQAGDPPVEKEPIVRSDKIAFGDLEVPKSWLIGLLLGIIEFFSIEILMMLTKLCTTDYMSAYAAQQAEEEVRRRRVKARQQRATRKASPRQAIQPLLETPKNADDHDFIEAECRVVSPLFQKIDTRELDPESLSGLCETSQTWNSVPVLDCPIFRGERRLEILPPGNMARKRRVFAGSETAKKWARKFNSYSLEERKKLAAEHDFPAEFLDKLPQPQLSPGN